GVPNIESHLANRAEEWLTPSLPEFRPDVMSETSESARARLRGGATDLGIPIQSRGRMDFLFSSSVPILPGVVVASFYACVDGLCMSESKNVSLVVWYGFGSSVLATKIGNRWRMGAAG